MTSIDQQWHASSCQIPLYYSGETRCPGCAGKQFYVGRKLAECARCGTALALAEREKGKGLWALS